MVATRLCGEGEWGVTIQWAQSFSLEKVKKFYRCELWWLYNTVSVFNATDLYTLK